MPCPVLGNGTHQILVYAADVNLMGDNIQSVSKLNGKTSRMDSSYREMKKE
jgi:hypothetical protein